jgi:hypothetical protein
MRQSIDDILQSRASKYGEFINVSHIAQDIKRVIHAADQQRLPSKGQTGLDDDQMEALEMIANKIGRILNGDPYYVDSWDDIAGYAKLVADRLRECGL